MLRPETTPRCGLDAERVGTVGELMSWLFPPSQADGVFAMSKSTFSVAQQPF